MIFTPEIALLAAATALLVTLVNCLLIFAARRTMSRQIEALRVELDANLSASHQLGRHVRALQRTGLSAKSQNAANDPRKERYSDTDRYSDDRYSDDRYSEDRYSDDRYADDRDYSHQDSDREHRQSRRDRSMAGGSEDSRSLADKLGLSQSEAEIVSHLKPRRSMGKMVRESA